MQPRDGFQTFRFCLIYWSGKNLSLWSVMRIFSTSTTLWVCKDTIIWIMMNTNCFSRTGTLPHQHICQDQTLILRKKQSIYRVQRSCAFWEQILPFWDEWTQINREHCKHRTVVGTLHLRCSWNLMDVFKSAQMGEDPLCLEFYPVLRAWIPHFFFHFLTERSSELPTFRVVHSESSVQPRWPCYPKVCLWKLPLQESCHVFPNCEGSA